MTSKERVRTLLNGKVPDRVPVFDLLRNDAAIEYYSGEKLTFERAEESVFKTISKALDATRPAIGIPQKERIETLPDGRKRTIRRWTEWIEQKKFPSTEAHANELEEGIKEPWDWSRKDKENLTSSLTNQRNWEEKLEDTFLFRRIREVRLDGLYTTVGLDQFSYLLADYPGVVSRALEYQMVKSLQEIDHIPQDEPIEAVFLASDIAFKDRTIFSPEFLREEFFSRLARVISACHKKGWKVMFHSDGNLMEVLDDLVETGIDLLNPIERLAGMEPKVIHKRYPDLILAGGIDVSQLLPYGKPQDIKREVIKTIEDTEGKIMIGSSTEIHNDVPLENVIALIETARSYTNLGKFNLYGGDKIHDRSSLLQNIKLCLRSKMGLRKMRIKESTESYH